VPTEGIEMIKLKLSETDLEAFIPPAHLDFVQSGAKDQQRIPALAKEAGQVKAIELGAFKMSWS